MKAKKWVAGAIVGLLAISTLAGCSGSTSSTAAPADTSGAAAAATGTVTTATAAGTTVDISKPVVLQYYMVGDANATADGLKRVTDAINTMAQKDINATVNWTFTTWTDYQNKYNLLLSAGTPIDMVYCANWLNYNAFCLKGAFLDLTDMLQKDTPDLYAHVPDRMWNQVKVNGKIYGVPPTYEEYTNGGIEYRKDLTDKYNIAAPTDFNGIITMLTSLAKDAPNSVQTCLNTPGDWHFGAVELLNARYPGYGTGAGPNGTYGTAYKADDPTTMINYWESPDFVTDMTYMKQLADAGVWSKSSLSDKVSSLDPISDGITYTDVSGLNPSKVAGTIANLQTAHPDWSIGFTPWCDITGTAWPAGPTQNLTCIPITAQNPDRALLFLEKLTLDKNYNNLAEYGQLGVDYNVDSNGIYQPLGDPAKPAFGNEGLLGWAWRNPDYMIPGPTTQLLNQMMSHMADVSSKDPFPQVNITGGFAEDQTSYQTERAALQAVCVQYLIPLEAGLAGDVNTAVATFLSKAKAAGLDTVQQGYWKQWTAYCQQYGYVKQQ